MIPPTLIYLFIVHTSITIPHYLPIATPTYYKTTTTTTTSIFFRALILFVPMALEILLFRQLNATPIKNDILLCFISSYNEKNNPSRCCHMGQIYGALYAPFHPTSYYWGLFHISRKLLLAVAASSTNLMSHPTAWYAVILSLLFAHATVVRFCNLDVRV